MGGAGSTPWEAPHPSPILGMYILPARPTGGADFKNAALREQYVVEAIWIV